MTTSMDQHVRVPSPHDKVYKEECTQCFISAENDCGVYVCMRCWDCGCAEHAKAHSIRSGHLMSIHVRKEAIVEQEEDESHEVTELAIGTEKGLHVSVTRFEVHTRVVQWPSGDLVGAPSSTADQCVAVVCAQQDGTRADESAQWKNELSPCAHTQQLEQRKDVRLAAKGLAQCSECDKSDNLWLCLTCGSLGCGRRMWDGSGGNGHAVAHSESSGHPVVCKMGTITPEGNADIYCYSCDNDVEDPLLSDHLRQFGIAIEDQKKTEKSMAELNLEYNMSLNVLQSKDEEDTLEPVCGSGLTGMHNVGNSCYMNSVLQYLLSIEDVYSLFDSERLRQHQLTCDAVHANCWSCQVYKLVHSIRSGKHSFLLPDKPTHDQRVTCGVRPRMFKRLFCEGTDFAGPQQQDAYEFFQHCLRKLQQLQLNGEDVTHLWKFRLQQRVQCSSCKRVRYSTEDTSELSLSMPLHACDPPLAEAPADEKADERAKRESLSFISLDSMLSQWRETSHIEGFRCPNCPQPTTALKSSALETSPSHLMIHVQRFTYNDWIPSKLSVQVALQPDRVFDLSSLCAPQSAPEDEQLMQDDAPDAPEVSEEIVQALMEMGFGRNRCERAAVATNNSSSDVAMNWLFEHMEDPDIDEPLVAPQSSASSCDEPSAESLVMLTSMGIDPAKAKRALRECSGDVERSIDWVFSHPDVSGEDDDQQQPNDAQSACDERPPLYRLRAFVLHKGRSVHSGHYVSYVRFGSDWVRFDDEAVHVSKCAPFGLAYMYFFEKIPSSSS